MPHKKAKRSIRDQQASQRGSNLPPTTAMSAECIPKSVSRVLDAAKIRESFNRRRRQDDAEIGDGDRSTRKRRRVDTAVDEKGKKSHSVMEIKPGETLGHFNKRVEMDMRPAVKSAIASSSATFRRSRKEELEESKKKGDRKAKRGVSNSDTDKSDIRLTQKHGRSVPPRSSPPRTTTTTQVAPKEFTVRSSSAPKRLNDIVLAPPEFGSFKFSRGVRTEGIHSRGEVGNRNGKGDGVLSMAQKVMMEEERERAVRRYREMKAGRTTTSGEATYRSGIVMG